MHCSPLFSLTHLSVFSLFRCQRNQNDAVEVPWRMWNEKNQRSKIEKNGYSLPKAIEISQSSLNIVITKENFRMKIYHGLFAVSRKFSCCQSTCSKVKHLRSGSNCNKFSIISSTCLSVSYRISILLLSRISDIC